MTRSANFKSGSLPVLLFALLCLTALSGCASQKLKNDVLSACAYKPEKVKFAVYLRLRNEGELDRLIAERNDPRSPNYRHYLTEREFLNLYAPAQSEVDTVVARLQKNGIKVLNVSPNHLVVEAEGNAVAVEKIFNVTVAQYEYKLDHAGKTDTHKHELGCYFLQSDPETTVPPDLKGLVRSVEFSQSR
jgi:subtilase family serine protease